MPDETIPERLNALLRHSFLDPSLFLQAVTHSSYANEHPPERSNETLAFLGDAVFGLVVARAILERNEEMAVGGLTQRRADIVSGKNLARLGAALGLGECLRLGRGEEQTGGPSKESLLAEALEALVGALYLEGGLQAAESFVLKLMALEESGSPS